MVDLVIANARIVDGTRAPAFPGWVGVRGDRIVAVETDGVPPPDARRTLDAGGRVVAPGFVDVHNHSDLSPLVLPAMPSTVRQGVTSVVVGNCGSSPWPLAGWDEAVELAYARPEDHPRPAWTGLADHLDAIDDAAPAVNVAVLVGHGSVRLEVLGLDPRPPDTAELNRMAAMVSDAVAAGAVGVSTGLVYVPGMFAATGEIATLARASAREGGLYASHIRGEGRNLFSALDEAIRIGVEADVAVHVSHLKCESARVWGRAADALARVHAGGVTADQYPYTAWASSLASLLPPWAPVAEVAAIAASDRDRLLTAVEVGEPGFQSSVDGVGWDRIVITGTENERWHGMNLAAIAEEMGCEPLDAMVRLLHERPTTSCIGHAMAEDDVRTILTDPRVFVASDASAIDPASAAGRLPVHPREYGTFPRVLAMTRELGAPRLEATVSTMTSLPAERFGLTDRGRVTAGAFADLVVFDPATVRDAATYAAPHAFPDGIDAVVVNGEVAWEPGSATIGRAGRAIRRR